MNLRFAVATMAVLIAVSPARASMRDDLVEALSKCVDLTDDHARLACYDQLSGQVKSVAAAPPAAPMTAQAPVPPPGEEKSWYDVSAIFGPGSSTPAAPDEGWQGVADFDVSMSGGFVVTLDNGQVWHEVDRDYAIPRFKRGAKNTVMISRALLGGYDLQLKGDPTLYKVKRSQ